MSFRSPINFKLITDSFSPLDKSSTYKGQNSLWQNVNFLSKVCVLFVPRKGKFCKPIFSFLCSSLPLQYVNSCFQSAYDPMPAAGLLRSAVPRLLVCSGFFNWGAALGGGPTKGFNNPEVRRSLHLLSNTLNHLSSVAEPVRFYRLWVFFSPAPAPAPIKSRLSTILIFLTTSIFLLERNSFIKYRYRVPV